MQLDTALQLAVMQAWEDLAEGTAPCSMRVEYPCEPGTSLDYLRVWSDRGGGYLRLVCDYWTGNSPAHPSGVRFANGFHSAGLGQTLDFIMEHQDQFTRRADACRNGLVLIYPPTGEQRKEAVPWISGSLGTATNLGGPTERSVPPPGATVPMEVRS